MLKENTSLPLSGIARKVKTTSAISPAIFQLTDVLSVQHALPSKPNLIQTSQRRTKMQTVSIAEQVRRTFDIPDTFQ